MAKKKGNKNHEPEPAKEEGDGAAGEQAPPPPEPVPPKDVLYCAVCSFPPEYCEFGSSFTKCKEWLKEDKPDLWQKWWSEEALANKVSTLSLEQQKSLEKEQTKKEAKATAKEEAALKKKLKTTVTIKRSHRSKNKTVTTITNLDSFGIELKAASKQFASKFATGASVTKNLIDGNGKEEIVVQGDVADDVYDMIENGVGVFKGGILPIDNVDIVEDSKKK